MKSLSIYYIINYINEISDNKLYYQLKILIYLKLKLVLLLMISLHYFV